MKNKYTNHINCVDYRVVMVSPNLILARKFGGYFMLELFTTINKTCRVATFFIFIAQSVTRKANAAKLDEI